MAMNSFKNVYFLRKLSSPIQTHTQPAPFVERMATMN